jgi:hypothetical protein
MTGPETAELEAVDAALAGREVAPEHADLAELALLLRDERPEPAAAWATGLDQRVKAGFPSRPKQPSRLRMWLSPGTLVPVLGVALVGLLITFAALSDGGGDDDGGGGSSASGTLEQSDSAESGGGAASSSTPRSVPPSRAGDAGSDARPNRRVERAANMTLSTRPRDIDRVASEVGGVASQLGGFVVLSSVSSSDGGTIELRVPSARLDDAVQRISRLARVRNVHRETRDITSAVVSARERLNDARTERKSLLRQLAAATTVNETESIRARLRIVSREIAAARARLRSVNNRAQFANVGVTLEADRGGGAADDDGGAWTPGDALDDAGRVLEVAAGVTVIVLAVALPFLIAGFLAWLARRGLARRRRERALDMA